MCGTIFAAQINARRLSGTRADREPLARRLGRSWRSCYDNIFGLLSWDETVASQSHVGHFQLGLGGQFLAGHY
jgi:hypothetical protein